MWNALQARVKGWTRHMALMMTWKVTCFALTKRTLASIYGANEGSESIIIKMYASALDRFLAHSFTHSLIRHRSHSDDTVHTISCDDQFAFYAWHRMLRTLFIVVVGLFVYHWCLCSRSRPLTFAPCVGVDILGNPNQTITNPAIFLAFMNGVEMLVNQYLKIGISNKKRKVRNLPPDGNTILHVFGQWLFEAIQFGPEHFDEGTALALKILINIITTKNRTRYLPTYMARFCVSLQQALIKDGRLLIAAINNGSNLLPFEIKGTRSLIPAFVYAVHRILTKVTARLAPTPTPTPTATRLQRLGDFNFKTLLCLRSVSLPDQTLACLPCSLPFVPPFPSSPICSECKRTSTFRQPTWFAATASGSCVK